MGYNLPINGIYWGYNPLTNHLLTSWDIQVAGKEKTYTKVLKKGREKFSKVRTIVGFLNISVVIPLTLPETNSEFTPENGRLEYFLVSFWGVGWPIFRCELAVSFREDASKCLGKMVGFRSLSRLDSSFKWLTKPGQLSHVLTVKVSSKWATVPQKPGVTCFPLSRHPGIRKFHGLWNNPPI